LLSALKDVNLMIQRTANLRVGKPKTTVVTECRAAVKANNFTVLTRIMTQGFDNQSK
jgi:Bardet-Biedl syndrome 2 protein